MQAFDIRSDR